MPSLARKFIVFAAVDGLVLQQSDRGQRTSSSSSQSVHISYSTSKITSRPQARFETDDAKSTSPYLEAYGLVGLLNIASSSFLICITERKEVAQILGKPIYVVRNVAIVPLATHSDANHAITQAQRTVNELEKESDHSSSSSSTDHGSDNEVDTEADSEAEGMVASPAVNFETSEEPTNSKIVQDVLKFKGRNSRMAFNWFNRRRWGASGGSPSATSQIPSTDAAQHASDESSSKTENGKTDVEDTPVEAETEAVLGTTAKNIETHAQLTSNKALEFLPKLLRYTKLIFASNNFFFAYEHDLTRQYYQPESRASQLPLHVLADPLYFWNKHLIQPFIDADDAAQSFVTPLIQGFVGQRNFTVAATEAGLIATEKSESDKFQSSSTAVDNPEIENEVPDGASRQQEFLLTLISRRSVQRPGLRYLRRGVDDEGNTANTVETEQILSAPDWDPTRKVYSLLQIRGSIPLYFTQSPYSLKPVPVLHHSYETNQLAFARHFRDVSRKYGKVQVVSLVDKHGVEAKIGEAYESYTRDFNQSERPEGLNLGFEWFDFHYECRGMKFENVKRLVDKLAGTISDLGETVYLGREKLKEQTGIIRTNCMDCLDRTGVTQCAFGQKSLENALKSEGYTIDLLRDTSTQWFNTLWADNGDAISKQYSSTAALKGDYTRTRKRNYRGALNDFGLTLSRYFNNMVNDYFSQACIDFLLGNVSLEVFSEFQGELKSIDPGISVAKLRQNAIDTCSKLVVDSQTEELVGGWALLCPRQPNTLRTFPFEETVLLLTESALYSCRFDWNTDKVLSFERISLNTIQNIHYGTYITSVLTDAQTDEQRNVGMVIVYRASDSNALRVNTRSLQSSFNQDLQDTSDKKNDEWNLYSWLRGNKKPSVRFMAFKALASSTSARINTISSDSIVSERVAIQSICEEIARAVRVNPGNSRAASDSLVEEREIISLAEAKKRTGYLEQLVYDVKKLVWA